MNPRINVDLAQLWPRIKFGIRLVFIVAMLSACGDDTPAPTATPILPTPTATVAAVRVAPTRMPTPTTEPGVLTARVTPTDTQQTLPVLAAHLMRVHDILTQPIPVLPLVEGLDDAQRLAQELALADPRFQADLREPNTGAALRNEIFGIYPVRDSDITEATAVCSQVQCYRVEMYNYALNQSTIAMVDVTNRRVLAVNELAEAQPDIPPGLTEIAQEIAVHAAEVSAALGVQPGADAAVMPNIKTALNRSRCERSRHLCVAPTFIQGERALWAIVDLTDGVLVGVRWTSLGQVNGTAVTEKSLQNEVVSQRYCDVSTALNRDNWQMEYVLTSSDGLRIANVRFADQPVVESAKLVDWHVSYSRQAGFGYSDAIGCPVFSQAAVVAFNGPSVEDIREGETVVGFALVQNYKSEVWPAPCNYFYSQRYEFYADGRFRVVVGNHGRGCGNDGTYRPVVRIALAGAQTFASWDGNAWIDWQTEQWQGPSDAVTPEGYQFRVLGADGQGYALAPGRGQFGDGGRGDRPFVYVTRRHTEPGANDEGDADLITIGPCCNSDYRQGPEKFIEPAPEPLAASELVIWYVAQLKNDDTPGQEYCWADAVLQDGIYIPKDYACYAGPLFVPVGKP